MESLLFNDLRKSLRIANATWRPGDETVKSLARTFSKHVNNKQGEALAKEFPTVFGTRSGKLTVRSSQTQVVDTSVPQLPAKSKSRKGKKGKTWKIGRYGSEPQARLATQQIQLPDALEYQAAVFPDPRNYGVEVQIISAIPVKDSDPLNPMYPWTIAVQLSVTGNREREWVSSFENKLRMQV